MPRLIGLLLTATAIAVAVLATQPTCDLFAQVKEEVKKLDLKKEEPKVELPVRRSADGFPIPTGAVHRFGNRQLRHADGISAAHVSPDGKLLVTRGELTVVVWDLETLNAKHVFNESDGGYSYYSVGGGLAFMPDSKGLLMSSGRNGIRTGRGGGADLAAFCDLETGKKKFVVRGGSGYQSAIWPSAKGKEIGTFTDYQMIRFFDATDGKPLTSTTLPEPMFQRVFLSNSGDLIAGLNNLEVLKVFETRGGKERFALEKPDGVLQLTISPDDKTLIYQNNEGKLKVFDLETKKERFSFAHPADKQPGPMKISADGNTLFFGGTQGQLYRWDLKGNRRLPDVGQHSTWTLSAIALSPDEKTLYSMGQDRLIRRWEVATAKQLPLPDGYITRTTIRPDLDGKSVLIADHVGRIDQWDLKSGQRTKQLHPGATAGINHLANSLDGRWLAAGCTTQAVRIWDLTKGFKEFVEIELGAGKTKSGTDHVQRVAFSPDSKVLYCSTEKTGLSAREVPSGKPIWNIDTPLFGFFFSVDPNGRWVVAGSGGYNQGPVRLNVVDAKTGKLFREMVVEPLTPNPNNGVTSPWVTDFTFLPGGATLLTTHYDGTIRLFDVESGKERKRIFTPDRQAGLYCSISLDGKWVALGGADRRLRIMELSSGKEIFTLGMHDSAVTQVAFTLDGRSVLSSADLAPLLWDLKPSDVPKLGTSDEIWNQLASEDAGAVYRLQWALMDHANLVKDLFAERVKPEEWFFDRKRYDQLVKNLDTPRFAVRETAQKELTDSQKIPLSWLRESFQTVDSEECKDRLRRVIETREKQPATKEWRILRCVQVLEKIATPEAKELLKKWSEASEGSVLASDARTALERLSK